jgi:hypothetical protein
MAYSSGPNYPTAAFVLSLIGGIFILLGGIYEAAIYAIVGSAFLAFLPGLGALLIGLAVVALLFGLIIIYGAIQMKSHPESAKTWGIIVLILAILSWIGGGGFVLGFLLALIGGILAIVWHPPAPMGGMGQPGQMGQAWGQPSMAPAPGAGTPMAAPGQKFCASCGSPNAAGVQFCAKCGAAMPP